MLALHWVDKRPMTMLFMVHTSEAVTLPPNCQELERSKPKVMVHYNVSMKGADLHDQLAQSYPATCKTINWYMRTFFNLLDLPVTSSLAIHKVLGGKMTQTEFMAELV